MNNVLFTANDGFSHGAYHFGRRGEQVTMPEHIAKQLVTAGLGTIKTMSNKMKPDSLGNAGGAGASSASLPVAPASMPTTSKSLGPGKLSLPKRGG